MTEAGSVPQQPSAEPHGKQIHITIKLVGTVLETASPGVTVPWKHPAVMRKGIRAININPRSYLTLFAWEADPPQPFSFSCIRVETKGFKSKPPVQEGWFLNSKEYRTYLLQTHFN